MLDTVAEADLKIQRLDALIMEETVINEPEAALAAAYVAYDEASITKILEEDQANTDDKSQYIQVKERC